MKKTTDNRILLPNGNKTKIKKQLGCSYPTIALALNGTITTTLHFQIRKLALELGGEEIKTIN